MRRTATLRIVLTLALIGVAQPSMAGRLGSWDDPAGQFLPPVVEPDTAHSHIVLGDGSLEDFLLSDALFTGVLTKELYKQDTVIAKYGTLLLAIDACGSGGFIGDLAATDNKESSLKDAGKVRPSVGVMTASAYNRCSISGGKGKDAFSAFSKGFTVAVDPPHPESDAWIGAFRTASKVVQHAQTITGFTLGDQAPQYWSTGDPVDSKTLGTGKDTKDVAFLVVEPTRRRSRRSEMTWSPCTLFSSTTTDGVTSRAQHTRSSCSSPTAKSPIS